MDEWITLIAKLGNLYGRPVAKERAAMLAQGMIEDGWTAAEVQAAYGVIRSNAECGKQISYDNTITPTVFDMARGLPEMMKYRLHTRKEAMAYCEEMQFPMSAIFEAVHVEGDEEVKLRMK